MGTKVITRAEGTSLAACYLKLEVIIVTALPVMSLLKSNVAEAEELLTTDTIWLTNVTAVSFDSCKLYYWVI